MTARPDPQRDLRIASKALTLAIQNDNDKGGGLISRETLRKADELRIAVGRVERLEGVRG